MLSDQIPITVCLPCYGRPQRTRRVLDCLANQTMQGFELVIIGDACKEFEKLIKWECSWFQDWKLRFRRGNNHLFYMNLLTNRSGHGYHAVNVAIQCARGRYFCWANNDDMLMPEHVEYYYKSIAMYENKPDQVDFVYNRTMVMGEMGGDIREPELKFGSCGHSELVVNTKFLKQMPPHKPVYGQDWTLIENMMQYGNARKGDLLFPTYYVMSTGYWQEKNFD